MVTARRDQEVVGGSVGIIALRVSYPLIPGNVINASTYDFPVQFAFVDADVSDVLAGSPGLLAPLLAAAQRLETRGVGAVFGSCGTFGTYQIEIASAIGLPVFMSVLTIVPWLLQSLPKDARLGILAASSKPLSPRLASACGITDASRLVTVGADSAPEFRRLLQMEPSFDAGRLGDQIMELVARTQSAADDIAAWVIQCSDLPPYAHRIQRLTDVPVFDLPEVIRWVQRCTCGGRSAVIFEAETPDDRADVFVRPGLILILRIRFSQQRNQPGRQVRCLRRTDTGCHRITLANAQVGMRHRAVHVDVFTLLETHGLVI